MKSRGLQQTSRQMLTLSLSSLLVSLPFNSNPLLLAPSFCCFFQSLTRFSPHAFPPPPHTFSHLSLPPHLLSLSSPLLFPLLPSIPTHSWYSMISLGNCTREGGLCRHWRQHSAGQQCMQHTAAVRLCAHFTGLARENDKLNRACHLWVRELIEMDISCWRIQPGEERDSNTAHRNGKTNNTLIPISIWINAFIQWPLTEQANTFDLALTITAANLEEKQHCASPIYFFYQLNGEILDLAVCVPTCYSLLYI